MEWMNQFLEILITCNNDLQSYLCYICKYTSTFNKHLSHDQEKHLKCYVDLYALFSRYFLSIRGHTHPKAKELKRITSTLDDGCYSTEVCNVTITAWTPGATCLVIFFYVIFLFLLSHLINLISGVLYLLFFSLVFFLEESLSGFCLLRCCCFVFLSNVVDEGRDWLNRTPGSTVIPVG